MKQLFKWLLRKVFIYFYAVLLPDNFTNYVKTQKINDIKIKWREMNYHNQTTPLMELNEGLFPLDKVMVGRYTYGPLCVYSFGSKDEQLKIGSYCSIAPGVKFILGGMHNYKHLSSYPFKAKFLDINETFSKGPIIIEDDVWIGLDVLVLSGITLSRGTVVASGSVVIKSTEPYSIVGGNPAKLIKYRFNQAIIKNLLQIDFENITKEFVKDNIDLLYSNIDEKSVEILVKKLSGGS